MLLKNNIKIKTIVETRTINCFLFVGLIQMSIRILCFLIRYFLGIFINLFYSNSFSFFIILVMFSFILLLLNTFKCIFILILFRFPVVGKFTHFDCMLFAVFLLFSKFNLFYEIISCYYHFWKKVIFCQQLIRLQVVNC